MLNCEVMAGCVNVCKCDLERSIAFSYIVDLVRVIFVAGQKLMYFTKDDECKMLGTIDLDGTKLEEIPFTRDEPDKFLFNIALGTLVLVYWSM